MQLTVIDIVVIVAFFAINLGIGLYFSRRGGTSLSEYFLSGRNVPWWLAGTSMVATTFAVDTPLAVTGFVAKNGIAGNWLWWNMVMSGILTVFFFAALWRRSGVLTDVEFIELRYGGKPATALRGVRAVYQGVIINTIIMGWVNLAMAKILNLTLHVPQIEAVGICMALTALYVMIGGFWSVLVTDLLQFVVKMSMTIVLAVAAVAAVGGIAALKEKLGPIDLAHRATGSGSILSFLPGGDQSWMPLTTFLVFIGVSWWASSYPGAEPGGGSYIAQRILSSKDEKNSILATLFFNVAHYALRPWPWILVALCALVLYPHGVAGADGKIDPELGYIQTMIDYLPVWLRGLMMAGFLAAYMSTIGTHLNLGASYLTNDLYKRFMVKGRSEAHYVSTSRVMTIVVLIFGAVVSLYMTSVGGAWKYMLTLTAGVGLVMILRWYWWRINAWSEITALAVSGVTATTLYLTKIIPEDDPNLVAKQLLITVIVTTIAWVVVTFATKPESEETLVRFFERVRPNAAGWGPIAKNVVSVEANDSLGLGLLDWLAGCGLVYGTLFGIGKLVLQEPILGFAWLAFALVCGAFIWWDMNRRNWETLRVRPVIAAALVTLIVALAPLAAGADGEKQLTNVKGKVSYEKSGNSARTLVPAASINLADGDVTVTGDQSTARITLPDSSRVTIASASRVEMSFFNQSDIANAKFVVYQGKARFNVEHPAGQKANYTFSTPTAQVAVRGTEGDIGIDGNELSINVYHLGDSNAPVEVTFTAGDQNGKTIKLVGGQSLVATLVNGIIQQKIDKINQAAIDKFNDLGVPTSIDQLKNQALNELRKRLPF